MGRTFGCLWLVVVLLGTFTCDAFLVFSQYPLPSQQHLPATTALFAKKKNKRKAGAKGFGVEPTTAEKPPPTSSSSTSTSAETAPAAQQDQQQQQPPAAGTFLQSVESGGSDAIPEEEELPPEVRAKRILREQYGLKTQQEQQLEEKQAKSLEARQKKMSKWQKETEKKDEGEFDLIAMLPPPVVIAIDRILKAGIAVTGTLFILAGIGITIEAWSKTSGNDLPENIDSFIVNTIEPNFTTGLLVLLGFSVSLGIFAGAQLGSASAVYKEDS